MQRGMCSTNRLDRLRKTTQKLRSLCRYRGCEVKLVNPECRHLYDYRHIKLFAVVQCEINRPTLGLQMAFLCIALRRMVYAEVVLHSFLSLTLDGGEWLG